MLLLRGGPGATHELWEPLAHVGLLAEHYYPRHVLNAPADEWPQAVNRTFAHLNPVVYVSMQGPSESGIEGDATLQGWDVTDGLREIDVPTLVVAGEEDTMDPKFLRDMSQRLPRGNYLLNPGGHLVQFDRPDTYYDGLRTWLANLEP